MGEASEALLVEHPPNPSLRYIQQLPEGDEKQAWREAEKRENEAQWKLAACKWIKRSEYDGKVCRMKTIFTTKRDGTKKARRVVLGQTMIKGEHYEHTYSPVTAAIAMRVLLMFIMSKRFLSSVGDVGNAYFNAKALKPFAVEQPKNIDNSYERNPETWLLMALASWYGAPPSGMEWYWT